MLLAGQRYPLLVSPYYPHYSLQPTLAYYSSAGSNPDYGNEDGSAYNPSYAWTKCESDDQFGRAITGIGVTLDLW
jgi:hypothetical protein